MSTKKRGLGRGLEALLGTGNKGAAPADAEPAAAGDSLRTLPIGDLQPGRYQPRTGMDADKLTELAESIKAQGLIQPIVVRQVGQQGGRARYEIIAGERRWRAATQAGLADVPVVVRDVDDRAVIAMALIENIQREDLNPLEEAQALSRLIDEFSLTHQQAAEAVGRSRAAVSNLLRLLELPDGIRRLLEDKSLEMGHARALLTLAPAAAVQLAKEAVAEAPELRTTQERLIELEDKVYELWYITDEGPTSAATFRPEDGSVQVVVDAEPADQVGITEEPDGGSPAPTGPILASGAL